MGNWNCLKGIYLLGFSMESECRLYLWHCWGKGEADWAPLAQTSVGWTDEPFLYFHLQLQGFHREHGMDRTAGSPHRKHQQDTKKSLTKALTFPFSFINLLEIIVWEVYNEICTWCFLIFMFTAPILPNCLWITNSPASLSLTKIKVRWWRKSEKQGQTQ